MAMANERKTKGKRGNPTTYTPEIATLICEGIARGDCLPRVCEAEGMPALSTVFLWLSKHKEFSDQYARAREAQGELMDQLIMEAASAVPERVVIRLGGDEGGTKEQIDTGDVQHRKLKIDALKWRAAHLRPKVYGVQRQEIEHSGKLTLEQLLAETNSPTPKDQGHA